MFKFLKILFGVRSKPITLILIQENRPAEPESFTFKPKHLFHFFGILLLTVIAVFFLTLIVTPAGTALFDKEDAELKKMAYELNSKMAQLNDSLKVRERFLKNMQSVLVQQKDTTYPVETYEIETSYYEEVISADSYIEQIEPEQLDKIKLIEPDKIIYSDRFSAAPKFPAPSPLNGLLTQKFDPQKKHFGIDIASEKGSIVRTIADGVVISADWSINYGNTIQIQHGDGYISIIKHCSSLLKKEGDVVLKGDAIGVMGMSGMISSGPHTHIELWRNGVALDPELYLLLN